MGNLLADHILDQSGLLSEYAVSVLNSNEPLD